MNQIVPMPERELPEKMGAIRATTDRPRAIMPQNLEDVARLAKMVVMSGLAPKDMDKPESCAVAIMHGMEIGLPPMMALQRIAVINGRPTIWGDAALALVRASKQLEIFREFVEGKDDGRYAVCELRRKGEADVVRSTFSVADAKRAGLWMKTGSSGKPTPWVTMPNRMLKMRARGFALRDTFADILGGLYLAEEIQDEAGMRDVTPPAPPPPPPPKPAAPPLAAKPVEAVNPRTTEQPTSAGSTDEGIVPDDVIQDWIDRLKAADKSVQEEIFEGEIEPAHEAGRLFPPDYNRLIALIKDA